MQDFKLEGLQRNEMSKMKSQYKVGYRAENRARSLLRLRGYLVVRSAGSKSPFDLIAICKKEIIAIQIKVIPSKQKISFNKLKKEIKSIPAPSFLKKELWVWEKQKCFSIISIL